MTKRTQKVGITRKYGTRYGSSLRKIIKKFELTQHAKYQCPFCGKNGVKRSCVGIWKCKGCSKSVAGGAWELTTSAAAAAKSTLLRMKKLREEMGAAATAPATTTAEEKKQEKKQQK